MLNPEQLAYWLLRAQCARTTEQKNLIDWELGLFLEGDELALVRNRMGMLPLLGRQVEEVSRLSRYADAAPDRGEKSRVAQEMRRSHAVGHVMYSSARRRQIKH